MLLIPAAILMGLSLALSAVVGGWCVSQIGRDQ